MAAGPELSQVVFRLFSSKEIRDLSVVEIKTSLCFNALDHPLKDGLYDLIMGPSGSTMETCGTCKQTTRYCPGHFGHIELPLPVVNPLFHKEIATLLKISCSNCFKIIMEPHLQYLLMYQLKLLDAGYIVEAQELETFVLNMEKEKTPDAALGELIKEQIIKRLDGIDFNRPPEKSAKTTESLRRQFIHNVMKQMKRPKQCPYCKVNFRKIVSYQNKLLTSVSKVEVADKFRDSADGRKGGPGAAMIFPEESRSMLRKIYLESSELILELYPILKDTGLENPVDMMYMDVVLVTPPKTRPVNYSDGKMIENNHTRSFKAIVNDCVITRNVIRAVQENTFDNLTEDCKAYVINIKGKTPTEKLHQCWLELQSDVDHLLDADMNKATGTTGISGMKQIIEKKMGILRMHMMGKRVNYAARSVITPDPNLQVQEIGIPEYFAKRLTYPVRVNHLNVQELREMVKRGPDVYPGATMVEDENGRLIRLFGGDNNQTKRDGVAKMLFRALKNEGTGTKIVHRHVQNGDMLLLNRQPTLHRPSMMAHKARILKGEKTLRMHYSNCKSYNADFDGDEMNAHLPQSELARSECRNIVNVASHYLVPKDGTPLGGLIQDHVISGVRLTIRGKFFNKQDYCQLVFQALSHKVGYIQLLPPTILKPRKLWSGKQIISTILINIIPKEKQRISLNASAKIGVKSWEKEKPRPWKCGTEFKDPKEMSESIVLIRNGELLEGVLDKQHYGATQYGLTHCLFELYGGQCSSSFLDSLGRCFTFNLQLNGFTIGVEDILVLAEPDSVRKEVIEKARKIGNEAAMRALDLEQVPVDLTERLEQLFYQDRAKFRKLLDLEYKKLLEEHTNQINKVCLPTGLVSKFPDNNLQLMVTSGAKGSQVNTMQISCLLGQIELEGQRPPWMISGKSLPSFRPFETAPVAGGYIDGRFMTGINPQDFFFHCMAGREGLIDTAVKTSRSGYLQRCLIKHLEGIMVAYDGTVRDHDGSVVQFAYGEDGLEVQKAVFLNKNQMDFLYENRESVADKANVKILKKSTETKTIKRYKEKLYGNPNLGSKCRITSPFTIFSSDENVRRKIKQKYWEDFNKDTGRIKAYLKLHKKWKKLSEEKKENYKVEQCLDPVTSKFRPHSDFGVITEKLEDLIKGYLETRSGRKKEIASVEKKKIVEVEEAKKEHVKDLINMKYMFSLCQPGEPVGLLAAQSVGEPSTQMTLNTFHFAGRGEMNVTLGIPRLREILMTAAKNIKTPNMDIPLMPTKAGNLEKRVKKLKKEFRRVTISDVLEKITVDEKLELAPTRIFTYTVRFDFLPHNCYKQEFNTNPSNILKFMEKDFLIGLSKEVRKLGKKYGDIIYESKGEKEMTKPEDEGEADNVDAAGIELRGNAQGFGEDHESSDEDGEMDDDDATKAKLRDRHEENRDYDEPEESEVEQSDEENEEETEENEDKAQRSDEEIEEEEMMTEEERKDVERRQKAVLGTFQIVKSYRYDVAKEEWCEIVIGIPLTLSKIDFSTILKDLCKKAVVYEIPNIKRAFAYEKNGTMMIQTDGINFIELFNLMQKYPKYFDVNKISSNDVYQVSQTYGIEAAVRVIVKELSNVFGVYGITVDHRHLSLIADYMTQQGTYSPFNRTGMLDNPSPFQQMTFESSVNFLKRALFDSKRDDLQSPSSRIMVGRFCASGTGCFDVINDPKSFESETRSDKFKSKLKIKSEEEM